MKILLVEDDQLTGELITKTLSAKRYTVDLVTDGETALELTKSWDYDLILLDVKLPKLDGIQVCQTIRSRGDRTPILMLTVEGTDRDVITGLDAGADDYLVKPCNLEQLLARIRSLLRRSTNSSASALVWGGLTLDPVSGQITYKQQNIVLRPKEYMLLELFLRYPQRIFSRNAIIDHLWTVDSFPSEGAVTNLIKDLRHRLTSAGLPRDAIETLYGLGYRLKALPQEQTPPHKSTEETTIDQNNASAEIEQLAIQFQASARQRLTRLEESVQELLSKNSTDECLWNVKHATHQLAGSLGMYGYAKASEIARSLDLLLSQEQSIIQNKGLEITQCLSELQRELEQVRPVSQLVPPRGIPFILVISEDDQWAESLQQEVRNWNLRLGVIPDWTPTQQRFVLEEPVAIVIDLSENARENSLDVLREIKQQFASLPVLTVSERGSLGDRVMTSRLGSRRYFTKPTPPVKLFEAIVQLLPQKRPTAPARVLIVDDDPNIHSILTHLLRPWGLEVTNLEEPERFWEVLTQTQPDLVLLDIEMPTFNGIELCRVIRQDTHYDDLPILVITAHTEDDYIRQVFDAGADDLIRKPIVDSELVTRVINRIDRTHLRQQLDDLRRQHTQLLYQQATVDPLTHIANRRAFNEFLQSSWRQLQVKQSPLSLILCDVDEFKLYNDRYGHPAGDVCLQWIASTIQQCIKPDTDQVARYGGEEFAIVLLDTSPSGAVKVAERIQEAISQLKIPHSETATHPYVTVSLGITGTIPVPERSIDNIVAMADRALYAAKERGRNTYCLFPL
jgi:diguanylate cyclase (GGDEF)-like protein